MKQRFLFLFLLSQVYSAPAIVTVWQTVTSTIPDGTTPAVNTQPVANTQPAAVTTTVQPVAASPVVETQAIPTTTATAGFWGNLLNSLLDSSSSSSSSQEAAAAAAANDASTTAQSTSSTGSSLASLLKGLFGGGSSESGSTSSSSSSIENAAATSEVPAAKAYTINTEAIAAAASVQASSVVKVQPTTSSSQAPPSSSSSAAASTSTGTSSSNGDIYAAISQCDGVDESFASEILDAHNKYRAIHQVGKLSWDVDTYNYAKNNADNYDCSGILTHTHGPYGENLAAGYKNGPATVAAWVDEPISYSDSSFIYNHFTQVIWKDSTKVGCAYKDCSSTGWGLYVVCEYDPYGNVIGEGKANVFPAT
ncbi:Secreted protein PRY1 [Candida tropicalis]